jgi:hypothetical protein
VPSADGLGWFVSTQTAVPLAHEMRPRSQGFAGTQPAPWLQALQRPPLQTEPLPQGAPLAAGLGLPVSVQTGVPLLQSMLPSSQAFAGAQLAPWLQAPQLPRLQTLPTPQLVPSATGLGVPVSWQTGVPLEQSIAPRSQTFAGMQFAPCRQARQLPALQTAPLPQGVPFAAALALPVSTQAPVPLLQSMDPWSQTLPAGTQPAPWLQATQAPALQTLPGLQLVPFAAGFGAPLS